MEDLAEKIEQSGERKNSSNIEKKSFVNRRLSDFIVSKELSNRTVNSLALAGISTTLDLTYITYKQLKKISSFGKKSLDEIDELCKNHSIDIGSNTGNIPSFSEGEVVISSVNKYMIGFQENRIEKGSKWVVLSKKEIPDNDRFALTSYKCKPFGYEDEEFAMFSTGSIEKADSAKRR